MNIKVDLTGIFVYICNKLANNDTINLLLLKEIVAKMSGCDLIADLNRE